MDNFEIACQSFYLSPIPTDYIMSSMQPIILEEQQALKTNKLEDKVWVKEPQQWAVRAVRKHTSDVDDVVIMLIMHSIKLVQNVVSERLEQCENTIG